MKCLVLGGAGFLGSNLCKELIMEGHDVVVFASNKRQYDNLKDIIDKITIITGNFEEFDKFDILTKDIDVVFHLISTTIPETSNKNMGQDIISNVLATINLLESCRKNNVKKVIFYSSGGTVYGIPQNVTSISEEHPNNPTCSYGIHKLTIEKYLNLFNHLYSLDFIVMRIANPYGERQSPNSGLGAIATFLARALSKETIEIWGDGSVTRDFIYVSDVSKAAIKLMSYEGDQKVFNVGSGRGYSLNEIVTIIESVTDEKTKIDYKEARKVDVPVNVLDISRITNEIDWYPEVSLESGIRNMVEYYRKTLTDINI